MSRPARDGRAWYADGLIAMAVVLGMIVAAAAAMKKWGGKFRIAAGSGGENLALVSRLALSPKQSVCLIRLGRQMVLVGVTPEQISALSVIEDPETIGELMASSDASHGQGLRGGFGRLFSTAWSRYGDIEDETEPPAEIPISTGDRHCRQARVELSGLLERLRSRGESTGRLTRQGGDGTGRGPIAIA